MSGGSLNYFYSSLEDHVGDFGDKELDDLVKDLSVLFHDREWFLSCDTGSGSWAESRDKFKEKWFTPAGRKDRIEAYLDELKETTLKSLGLSDAYCINCKHWTPEKEEASKRRGYDNPYGICDNHKSCLMHRKETCEKFEKR